MGRMMTALAVVITLLAAGPPAKAQLALPTLPPGWNMVGGPTGSKLGGVAAFYSYGPFGYAAADSTNMSSCVGYFAYLPSAEEFNPGPSITNGIAPHGTTMHCPLQPGWTMVGNPFNTVALLQEGFNGFWWNPRTSQYQLQDMLTWSGAVWIYSPTSSTVTLTAQ